MAQILIRHLDPQTVKRLKERAKVNRRSLQGEVKVILEQAAGSEMVEALKRVDAFRHSLGRTFSDSTELIREDRER